MGHSCVGVSLSLLLLPLLLLLLLHPYLSHSSYPSPTLPPPLPTYQPIHSPNQYTHPPSPSMSTFWTACFHAACTVLLSQLLLVFWWRSYFLKARSQQLQEDSAIARADSPIATFPSTVSGRASSNPFQNASSPTTMSAVSPTNHATTPTAVSPNVTSPNATSPTTTINSPSTTMDELNASHTNRADDPGLRVVPPYSSIRTYPMTPVCVETDSSLLSCYHASGDVRLDQRSIGASVPGSLGE